jgi:Site-specific recombinase XerD
MILSNIECKLLLEYLYHNKVTDRQKKYAVRNLTMAVFMLEVGLRLAEVVNLVVSDLLIADKPLGVLNVTRGLLPGHRRRTIPLNEKVKSCVVLMNEFWWKPDTEKPGNYAFYDVSPLKHITETQFRRIIKTSGEKSINYPVRPNLLRRTCAARLLEKTDHQTVENLLDYKTDQASFYR